MKQPSSADGSRVRTALLVAALLAGCASRDLRTATRYESEGRLLDAATVWVAHLEADMDDLQARHRLELVQRRAWEAEVARADAALAAGDPAAAVAVWRGLVAFRQRLAGVEATMVPSADDVGKSLAKAEEALADSHYEAGNLAAAASRWEQAITEYNTARAVRPEYRDTTPRIATALAAQGDLDRGVGNYVSALKRYDDAYALSGSDDAQRWATAIRVAWGRADLAAGRCRAAFDRLTAALVVDPSVAADLERAQQCARLELVVPAAEDLTAAAPTGISVAGLLSDRLGAELRGQGSAHVRLLDAVAPPPPGAGRRYTVRTRITEQTVAAKDATAERSVAGVTQVACDSLSSDAFVAGVGYVCDADVLVTWTENIRTQEARVAGTVRWYGVDGVELASEPFVGTDTHEVRWVTAYLANGAEVKRGTVAAPGVVVLPVDPMPDKPGASDAPDATLITAATHAAAKAAAAIVLAAVDKAEESPPPARLDLRSPGSTPQIRVIQLEGHGEPM